jgi:hypothetical protein
VNRLRIALIAQFELSNPFSGVLGSRAFFSSRKATRDGPTTTADDIHWISRKTRRVIRVHRIVAGIGVGLNGLVHVWVHAHETPVAQS